MRACARFGVKIKRAFCRGGVATLELLAGLEFLQLEHRSIFRSPFSQHGAFCHCRLFNSFYYLFQKEREKNCCSQKFLLTELRHIGRLVGFIFQHPTTLHTVRLCRFN